MNTPKRIIVVEDDADIRHLLEAELTDAGYVVEAYPTGIQGLSAIRENEPDLVILDLGLPDVSGQEIARRVRRTSEFPIIILTAADEVGVKVEMLNSGADDYLAKPFHSEELLARINVQLRKRTVGNVRQIGDLFIDTARYQVMWEDTEVKLSRREYDLLVFLAGQPGRVYSRKEIEQSVWGGDLPPSSNVVDVHMGNIRSKLRDAGGYGLIRTVRGVGYSLKA